MRLRPLLARLLGRRSAVGEEAARRSAAEDLEQATQAHYRKVTGVDSTGRSTKPKQEQPQAK